MQADVLKQGSASFKKELYIPKFGVRPYKTEQEEALFKGKVFMDREISNSQSADVKSSQEQEVKAPVGKGRRRRIL